MGYNITIDHNNKLFIYRHTGIISKEDIGVAWQELLQKEEFTMGKYNMLTDYRDAKYNMATGDIDEMTRFLKNLKGILFKKKQALVVKDKVTTAFSMLFESMVVSEVGFEVQVFSSIDSAKKWLTR